MTVDAPPMQQKPVERPYRPKLDTRPMLPRDRDGRYPRHGLVKWFRMGLRLWFLPLQIYVMALVGSLAAWAVLAFIPGAWPHFAAGASQALDTISATGQALLLAPLASLIRHYPLSVVALVLLLALLWSLDWWALADRRRERGATHARTHRAGQMAVPLRLHGDIPFREDAVELGKGKFDPLEYHTFVDVVARLILNSADSSPLVISLEARWGMGKTTAMRMIQRRLNDPKALKLAGWRCFTIYFNAWKYDGGMDVRNGLMTAVFEAIPRRAIQWHLRQSRGLLFGLLASAAGLFLPSSDAAGQILKRMDHEARYRNEFEYDFRRILDHWASVDGKRPLLVVFVDDLDRCLPPDATRTLETIKLFFDIPGCIFVLGFDPDRLAQFVHQQHPETDGAEYLKKLVQLNYRLPKPADHALEVFTQRSSAEVGLQDFFEPDMFDRLPGGITTFIRRGTGGNPREIMRFLNAIAVSTEVVHPQLRFDTDRIGLSFLMMLQVRWPDVYRDVVEQLADKWAAIDKTIAGTAEMPRENREELRANALYEVLSELYRDWGLFPDVADSNPPDGEGGKPDEAGGNATQ